MYYHCIIFIYEYLDFFIAPFIHSEKFQLFASRNETLIKNFSEKLKNALSFSITDPYETRQQYARFMHALVGSMVKNRNGITEPTYKDCLVNHKIYKLLTLLHTNNELTEVISSLRKDPNLKSAMTNWYDSEATEIEINHREKRRENIKKYIIADQMLMFDLYKRLYGEKLISDYLSRQTSYFFTQPSEPYSYQSRFYRAAEQIAAKNFNEMIHSLHFNDEFLCEILNHTLEIRNTAHTDSDEKGNTPLYLAVKHGHYQLAKLLIEKQADINYQHKNLDGITPLMIATQNKDIEMVKLLLNNKADVNLTRHDGTTPLQIAAYIGETTIFELILESGAEINVPCPSSYTALYIAIDRGHDSIAQRLLEKGAKVYALSLGDLPPLFAAVEQNNAAMIELLIKHGANPNQSVQGTFLLDYALKNKLMKSYNCLYRLSQGLIDGGSITNISIFQIYRSPYHEENIPQTNISLNKKDPSYH